MVANHPKTEKRAARHFQHFSPINIIMTGSTNGGSNGSTPRVGTDTVKMGLAQMLKGGVIVSQSNEEEDTQARDATTWGRGIRVTLFWEMEYANQKMAGCQ